MKNSLLIPALLAGLASCAAEPGKGDIEAALTQHYAQAAAATPTFENLEVGACAKAASAVGYVCSVSADVQFQSQGRTLHDKLTGSFVFDRVGGSWKVVATQ